MPKEMEIGDPKGLLTHLRIAIQQNEEDLAGDIAILCTFVNNIGPAIYCKFIGRICLEDKYPDGKDLFDELNEKVKDKSRVILNQQRYVELAKRAAKIKTNCYLFVRGFNTMYEAVYGEKIQHVQDDEDIYSLAHIFIKAQRNEEIEDGMTVGAFKELEPGWDKESGEPGEYSLLIEDDPIITGACEISSDKEKYYFKPSSTEMTIYEDGTEKKVELTNTPIECTKRFSNDDIIRCLWKAKGIEVPKEHEVKQTVKVTGTKLKTDILNDGAFINENFDTLVKTRHKILSKKKGKKRKKEDEGSDITRAVEITNLLYRLDDVDEEEKQLFINNMSNYINKNQIKHYYGPSVLAELRDTYRAILGRPQELLYENVTYSLRYTEIERDTFKVQLGVPENAKNESTMKEYPNVNKKFTVSFPKNNKRSSNPTHIHKPPKEKAFKVVHYETVERNEMFYYVEEIQEGEKIKIKHIEGTVPLQLLQLLIYRYEAKMRTKLKDIYIDEDKNVYSRNQNSDSPNTKHPDVWQRLIFKEKSRLKSKDGKILKKSTYTGKSTYDERMKELDRNSYFTKIVEKLKHWLQEADLDTLSAWTKDNYIDFATKKDNSLKKRTMWEAMTIREVSSSTKAWTTVIRRPGTNPVRITPKNRTELTQQDLDDILPTPDLFSRTNLVEEQKIQQQYNNLIQTQQAQGRPRVPSFESLLGLPYRPTPQIHQSQMITAAPITNRVSVSDLDKYELPKEATPPKKQRIGFELFAGLPLSRSSSLTNVNQTDVNPRAGNHLREENQLPWPYMNPRATAYVNHLREENQLPWKFGGGRPFPPMPNSQGSVFNNLDEAERIRTDRYARAMRMMAEQQQKNATR